MNAQQGQVLLADEAPIHELDELKELIAEGHGRGFLTVEQITARLEEVELTKEQVGELRTHLVEQGIDILYADGKPPGGIDRKGAGRASRAETAPHAGSDTPPDLTVEPSLDSLRLYLRSIGKVPLLTAAEEVSLAKRIERGDMAAKQ